MAFDAQKLWWPPARNLYNSLEKLQADSTSVSVSPLQALLDEAYPALHQGLLFFKREEAAARQTVERQPSLALGSKKLPLDQALRGPAITAAKYLVCSQISRNSQFSKKPPRSFPLASPAYSCWSSASALYLLQGLNEVQSYILLRRCVQEQGEEPKNVQLGPDWLQQAVAYYATERSRLLRCIEAVLTTGARHSPDNLRTIHACIYAV